MSQLINPYFNPDRIVVLSADKTVNNSDVLSDSDITAQFSVGYKYWVNLCCFIDSPAANDAKIQLTSSLDWSGNLLGVYINTAGTATVVTLNVNSALTIFGGGAASNYTSLFVNGMLTTLTAGTVTLQFAQATAGAVNTKLLAGSHMRYRKLT